MVECYLPRTRSTELAEVATRLSTRHGRGGQAARLARYVRSTYLPGDEICFHLFEAESIEAVREVSLRASLVFDRIVEAEEDGP
jgi:hypothetical protein